MSMLSLSRKSPFQLPGWAWGVLAVLAGAAAAALRWSLIGFESDDYISCLARWYDIIQSQGSPAFATAFSNYTPPYLYMLYLIHRIDPQLSSLIAVKIPSMLADFAAAGLMFATVRAALPHKPRQYALWAALAVLFAPSVVINSALWGQADMLFSAALLGSFYGVLRGRGWSAWVTLAFGVSLAFKLQAIFFAPFLALMVLQKRVSWAALLLIPVPYLAAIVPSWLLGRPLWDLLTIYLTQADTFVELTLNAPNLYAWLPDAWNEGAYLPGMALAALGGLAYLWLGWKTRPQTPAALARWAFLSVLLMPFLLPRMHERYFFPADVFALLAACLAPRLWRWPVAMISISLIAYVPFLTHQGLVRLWLPAIALTVLLVDVVRHCLADRQRAADQPTAAGEARLAQAQ